MPKRKFSDLKYKFIRGLLAYEKHQRNFNYLKAAAEWTSRAIVSLELAENEVRSVKQAQYLEAIGGTIADKLKCISVDNKISSDPPPIGKYLSSGAALLVALYELTQEAKFNDTDEEPLIHHVVLRDRCAEICEERFAISSSSFSRSMFCCTWWRLKILEARNYVKKRTRSKEAVYQILPLGVDVAERLKGINSVHEDFIPTAKPTNDALYTTDDGSDGVVMCIDQRELGGDHNKLITLHNLLSRKGIKFKTMVLHVGDYAWFVRRDGDEEKLPVIVERKRGDDFAESLMDGRLARQKNNMKEWKERFNSAVVQLWFVIEGNIERFMAQCGHECIGKCGNPNLLEVATALSELESDSDFTVAHTDHVEDTVKKLMSIHMELQTRVGDFHHIPSTVKVSAPCIGNSLWNDFRREDEIKLSPLKHGTCGPHKDTTVDHANNDEPLNFSKLTSDFEFDCKTRNNRDVTRNDSFDIVKNFREEEQHVNNTDRPSSSKNVCFGSFEESNLSTYKTTYGRKDLDETKAGENIASYNSLEEYLSSERKKQYEEVKREKLKNMRSDSNDAQLDSPCCHGDITSFNSLEEYLSSKRRKYSTCENVRRSLDENTSRVSIDTKFCHQTNSNYDWSELSSSDDADTDLTQSQDESGCCDDNVIFEEMVHSYGQNGLLDSQGSEHSLSENTKHCYPLNIDLYAKRDTKRYEKIRNIDSPKEEAITSINRGQFNIEKSELFSINTEIYFENAEQNAVEDLDSQNTERNNSQKTEPSNMQYTEQTELQNIEVVDLQDIDKYTVPKSSMEVLECSFSRKLKTHTKRRSRISNFDKLAFIEEELKYPDEESESEESQFLYVSAFRADNDAHDTCRLHSQKNESDDTGTESESEENTFVPSSKNDDKLDQLVAIFPNKEILILRQALEEVNGNIELAALRILS